MKKLLTIVCLSGLLSVPSVVLGAETMAGPSLYGSFRAGVGFGENKDAAVHNHGSRWGIKGSVEVSEGLTAAYKYETGLQNNVSAGGLQAADCPTSAFPVDLELITAGQIWSASL